MRALLLSTPYATHFMPMVPIAWALRTLGYEVLVAGQPEVTEAAAGAGLCTETIGERFHGFDELVQRLAPGERPLRMMGRTPGELTQAGTIQWAMHARYHVRRYLELAREFSPSLVISERVESAGPIVAAALGVPSIAHRWGVDPMGDTARDVAESQLTGVCERLGLDGFPGPTKLLDPCPPELQLPNIEQGWPIRYIPFNGTGERPGWVSERNGRVRRVCVTFGKQTLALNGVSLLRTVIAAAGGLAGTEFVVTAEPEYHKEIGNVPDNVRLVEPTPLNLFLDDCDAVLHHGGASTVLTTIYYGLPQIVLPQIADQFVAAKRLSDAGAAKALFDADTQDDVSAVRQATLEVLEQAEYRAGATRLQRSMVTMTPPAEVAGQLHDLAAGVTAERTGTDKHQ